MKRFKSARHARRFLSTHSRIHNHFQLRRYHLNVNRHRVARCRLSPGRDVAEDLQGCHFGFQSPPFRNLTTPTVARSMR